MVIKLTPDQVAKIWDYVRAGILSTPSPLMDGTPEAMRNILRSLLIGELQCWAILKQEGDQKDVYGYMLTTIATDYISKSRFLNIYDIFAFKAPDHEIMRSSMGALNEFAKANGCRKITAYSNIDKVIGLAQKFGFQVDTQFLTKEVL